MEDALATIKRGVVEHLEKHQPEVLKRHGGKAAVESLAEDQARPQIAEALAAQNRNQGQQYGGSKALVVREKKQGDRQG